LAPAPVLGLPDARWLPAALELQLWPVGFVHDSWYPSLPHGDVAAALRALPDCRAHVNRWLRDVLRLPPATSGVDFAAPLTRLALLPSPVLGRLCLFLGAALYGDALRREIDGARVRLIRAAVGDAAFELATKRAPLLGSLPCAACDLSVATVPDFTASGAACCADLLRASGVTEDTRRRFELKLPRPDADGAAGRAADAGTDGVMPPFLRKLIAEVSPEWLPLFA
jgi:hypothetical protein